MIGNAQYFKLGKKGVAMRRVADDKNTDEGAARGDLVIPLDKVPVAAFQAIYYNLTQKTEELAKEYDVKFEIDVNSINDFHRHFQQLIAQYQVKASNSQVVVSLANGEVSKNSSVEMFSTINWKSKTARCSHISLEYDFLIILPIEELTSHVAQRFKVVLSTSMTAAPYSEISVISPGHRFPTELSLTSRIEYSDITVARSVQAIIDDWAARLEIHDQSGISDKIVRNFAQKSWTIVPILMISSMISGIFFEVPSTSEITPMRYLLVVLTIVVSSAFVGAWIAEKASASIRLLGMHSAILITKGDESAKTRLVNKQNRRKKTIAMLGAGVLLAGIVGFVVNALSAYLLP